MDLIELSKKLLLSAKTNAPAEDVRMMLTSAREADLAEQLLDDNLKKSFWINIYNAYTQILLSADPAQFVRRNAFFGKSQVTVAGHPLSLDDIEHGLLRRSKIKWSFGYLQNPFPGLFERNHRVNKLDFRIHFALNCGAASCPAIAYYDPGRLDSQLDLAMSSYLQQEVSYDPLTNVLALPELIGWYRNDFGGLKNFIRLLKAHSFIPRASNPEIRFKKYNWDLLLRHYTQDL